MDEGDLRSQMTGKGKRDGRLGRWDLIGAVTHILPTQ